MYWKEIISVHSTIDECFEHESILIGDNYKKDPKCLNRSNQGKFFITGHSEQTKKKMRGPRPHTRGPRDPLSEELKAKLSKVRIERQIPPWNKGISTGPMPEEHKELRRGKPAWNKGISTGPQTEEHKEKVRLTLLGNQRAKGSKRTPEQNERRSQWMMGNTQGFSTLR